MLPVLLYISTPWTSSQPGYFLSSLSQGYIVEPGQNSPSMTDGWSSSRKVSEPFCFCWIWLSLQNVQLRERHSIHYSFHRLILDWSLKVFLKVTAIFWSYLNCLYMMLLIQSVMIFWGFVMEQLTCFSLIVSSHLLFNQIVFMWGVCLNEAW